MAINTSINFLPEYYQTVTNKRFTGATIDNLITDSKNVLVNGYIGRTFAPTYKLGDNYVPEPNNIRKNYQLEPSVVIKDINDNIILNSTYIDLLQSIANNGGLINNHQRLFESEYYNYNACIDYDKFVNYYNYYWIPGGPDAVTVSSSSVPLINNFTLTRNTAVNGYTFSGLGGYPNPQLTLARGGTYSFNVDQPGFNFSIQSEVGILGVDPNIPTINTRQVFGVKNNNISSGQITFNVPLASAQNFYTSMTKTNIDAGADFTYGQIQGSLLSTFLTNVPNGLDGIINATSLQNKTFVFLSGNFNDDSLWTVNGITVPRNTRQDVWQINLISTGTGDYIINIRDISQQPIAPEQKVFIQSGETYASLEYWLDNLYNWTQVPLITAPLNYLYYQDSANPEFVGQIKIVDNVSTPINVNKDIIGQLNYVSGNGVIFTNGLKIQFDNLVVPSSYAGNQYYVEGVGTSIQLVPVTQLVALESLAEEIQTTPDYITINRASQDQNAWSRTNNWFHIDVLTAIAKYNNIAINYGPNLPGRRAIIEFESNLKLFNFGNRAKSNIDLITFDSTDAFANIEGSTSYTLDGVVLISGMRIVFANDYNVGITNEIWLVDFEIINSTNFLRLINTGDDPVQVGENILVLQGQYAGNTYYYNGTIWKECQEKIKLNQAPLFDVIDANGYSFADTTVYPNSTFNGTKFFGYSIGTGTNDNILGFPLTYQNFNNIGDIVFSNYYDIDTFSYTTNTLTGETSTVNINSGYVVKYSGSTANKIINWVTGVDTSKQNQLITKFFDGRQISINGVNYPFVQVDITPKLSATIPYLKVYLNNILLNVYTDLLTTTSSNGVTITGISWYGIYPVIALTGELTIGDKIDVEIFSNTASSLGYYKIPNNLDINSLNQNFADITLGQLRTHYNELINNTQLSSDTLIPNRDRYLKSQGGTLLKQSSPIIYAQTFLIDPTANYINSIYLARNEYTRFKNKFINLCTTIKGLNYNDPVSGVDTILSNINSVKNSNFPWYYSDMVPQGANYSTITYTVLNSRQTNYEITSIFNINELSNLAVLIYLNGVQLSLGIDYTFSKVSPEVIFSINLMINDVIVIREYSNTDGNYIPETPTKLGLAPSYTPQIYTDNTYLNPISVIQGHDGSITPAFGDFRDQYLLEIEKRIFNNIKISYIGVNEIDIYDTIPGKFRTTDYSLNEWNQILSQNFLLWVGSNNIDYTTNTNFDANNSWTWNYDQFTDVVDGSYLQGSWRAIYNYWFDTDTPHTTPWKMLGFTQQPNWWELRYGPAPYTSGNSTLWEDLEQGYIWNNGSSYYDVRFVRPGLSGKFTNSAGFVPVDTAGNLLSPMMAGLVRQTNPSAAGNSFQIGEHGPVETAWRKNSDFAYGLQVALALARPAQYFSTQIDLSRFKVNPITNQFDNENNQKITPSLLAVNGDTITQVGSILRTAGYINWIADNIKNIGKNPITILNGYFSNFSVQLAYRVAGFTDKNLISVTAEQTSPGSTNASIIIPDENYNAFIGKPVALNTVTYSGVIITNTDFGYSVTGYDNTKPYFTVIPSIANKELINLQVESLAVKLYQTGTNNILTIPYGTTFKSAQQVADFLISYQRYLTGLGFVFDVYDNNLQKTRDWILSINEFLTWAQQGWPVGTILVLNPVFDSIKLITNQVIVDTIQNSPNTSRLLDTNFRPIKNSNFNLLRQDNGGITNGNTFTVNTVDGLTGIAFARLDLLQYETTLLFDNVDSFGDIIYIPEQGTRQYRLKLNGTKTGYWSGALNPTGYIYSNPNISMWQPGTDYNQGDIVTFNNNYYTAPINIVAATTFNQSNWTPIQLSDIQTGLLPSFGHNAQIFTQIYDVDNPPNDENFQMFSAGLIGFRERPFLSNLGISIPTQTKFYQGYIKQKGTQNVVNSLTKASFNNINGNINVYEEWAFQVGSYGGINSNQFIELILDQSVFRSNPVAFTLVSTPSEYSTSNIIVNLAVTGNTMTSNVYNASNLTSNVTSIYNNRNAITNYSGDLPTPGYVNLTDVDYQIFDIATITTLPTLVPGNLIWTAIDFNPGWNVYRVTDTGLTANIMNYTLDSTAQLEFTTTDSLFVDQYIVLQGFSSVYDGMYQINGNPTSNSVTITVADGGANLISSGGSITGTANVFTLNSMVVQNYASIGSNPPYGGWINGDTQWVNVDQAPGSTGWAVYQYNNGIWARIRQQQPSVDITSINRIFLFNDNNNTILATLDFIDPAKGKVLSAVDNDIDYKLISDPAYYNAGNNIVAADFHWGEQQVGSIWWDVSQVYYLNYEQDTLTYRLNYWGQTFPGSNIAIYEWVRSPVLPSQYASIIGDGIPLHSDDSAYSVTGYVTQTGAVQAEYYFWVAGKTSVAGNKNNSAFSIANAIANPQSQGVPYATILRNDTLALYNINNLLTGKNSVLHISKVNSNNFSPIHSEYTLVQENNPDSQIPAIIERKLIDSLSRQDYAGNTVPDPTLLPSQSYGIQIRPRQSMFINQSLALSNYINYVNSILITYPVIERKIMTIMNSSEPVPSLDSGQYSKVISVITELAYIDTTLISSGYSVLVTNDATNLGKWAIYMWSGTTWSVVSVQSYKTNLYWNYVDWYNAGYNYTVAPDVTVANKLDFGKLTLVANTYIKILNNGNNQFEIYYIDSNLNQNLYGIENGTIQISTDSIPPLELRQILTAIQTNIFINDLAINYNKLFFIMMRYALTEQKNIDWAFKTSFLNATQNIRALQEFPAYVADDQQYYLDYLNEVKPYRTTVRNFIINYEGNDNYSGDATDFDLQPYWDANLQIYRSPNGEQPYDDTLLSSNIYSQWYNNYKYQVVNIVVNDPGTGYVVAPEIIITGDGATNATAYATLNGYGGIANIIITDPGKNFTTTPTVIINGTGTGASAYAEINNVYDINSNGHNLIRNIQTTIKFDRITYTNPNTFVFWSNITNANVGQTIYANTILVNNENLYVVGNTFTIANTIFPSSYTSLTNITYSDLNNANDRIIAANGNIDLTLTQTGLVYPGVIIDGNTFVGNTFDTNIQSFYSNVFGVNPYDVTVDGGFYVSNFENYAPEELIPGRMYETFDFSVYSTDNLAYRLFNTMNGISSAYRINGNSTAQLRSNLSITDTTIIVDNALALSKPNIELNIPGVVFINGEKIIYWRNFAYETPVPFTSNLVVPTGTLVGNTENLYITLGNIYELTGNISNVVANISSVTANSLGQIRRAVDGTSPFLPNIFVWTGTTDTVIPYGTTIYYNGNVTGVTTSNIFGNIRYVIAENSIAPIHVVDSSVYQLIPNNTITNTQLTNNVIYTVSSVSSVSYGLQLTSNVSANIGDIVTQGDTNGNIICTMRVLGNVLNSNVLPIIMISGSPTGLPDVFDGSDDFDQRAFDNIVGFANINGVLSNSYITGSYLLGNPGNIGNLINISGSINVPTNSIIQKSNIWYSPGFNAPTNGQGLENSVTSQATFLKSGIYPYPPGGVTP